MKIKFKNQIKIKLKLKSKIKGKSNKNQMKIKMKMKMKITTSGLSRKNCCMSCFQRKGAARGLSSLNPGPRAHTGSVLPAKRTMTLKMNVKS